jgi:hypothetical protein
MQLSRERVQIYKLPFTKTTERSRAGKRKLQYQQKYKGQVKPYLAQHRSLYFSAANCFLNVEFRHSYKIISAQQIIKGHDKKSSCSQHKGTCTQKVVAVHRKKKVVAVDTSNTSKKNSWKFCDEETNRSKWQLKLTKIA